MTIRLMSQAVRSSLQIMTTSWKITRSWCISGRMSGRSAGWTRPLKASSQNMGKTGCSIQVYASLQYSDKGLGLLWEAWDQLPKYNTLITFFTDCRSWVMTSPLLNTVQKEDRKSRWSSPPGGTGWSASGIRGHLWAWWSIPSAVFMCLFPGTWPRRPDFIIPWWPPMTRASSLSLLTATGLKKRCRPI